MNEHPNAQDRLHARPGMTEELPDSVAEAFWSEMAPVQQDHFGPAGRVPMRLARLAWDAYKAAGHDQTMEDVNRRGGFSWGELILLLRGPAHYKGPHWTSCYKGCGKDR